MPAGYAVTTSGAAVRVVSTQQPAFSIATADLVDQTLGLVSSSFGSSTSESRAASYYPGDLLAQAGQLICGQFGPCPVDPPTYPLLAEASWPTVEHATADPAGQVAGVAVASATQASNAASTTVADGRSGGLTLGGVTSATSTTTRADGLHVHVETSLHRVAFGPLRLDAVRVWDDVVVHPDGAIHASPHVVASGVTVAGTPVELGSTPVPALAQRGLSVRLLGTESAAARSGATGVRVDVSVPVSGSGAPVPGVPTLDRTYVGSFVLGQVAVVAARDGSFELPALPLPQLPATGPPLQQQPALPVPVDAAPPGSNPWPPAVLSHQPPVTVVLRAFQLDDLDLADLYAVLALGALVGLVASRALTRRAWS
jgi:hypothetical protein